MSLDNPVHARLLIKAPGIDKAQQLAKAFQDDPQRWLHLADSDQLLFADGPSISRDESTVELTFAVPETTARLLLQRLAKSDTSTVVASQPTAQQSTLPASRRSRFHRLSGSKPERPRPGNKHSVSRYPSSRFQYRG